MAMYCGKDCQRKAWREGHKDRCQQTRNEFRDVVLQPKPELLDRRFKMVFGDSYAAPRPTSKFTVKVSVMFHSQLLVRNEDGSVTGLMVRQGQDEVFIKLKKKVEEEGLVENVDASGMKAGSAGKISSACFYALNKGQTKEGGWKLEINIEQIQPMVMWR